MHTHVISLPKNINESNISGTINKECESICEKNSSGIIWNAWKDVLYQCIQTVLKVWKWGFVKSKKVWNQIKIWTLTSLIYKQKGLCIKASDIITNYN